MRSKLAVVWRSTVLAMFSLLLALRADAAESASVEAVINAPVATLWQIFTTGEGYRQMGAAHADVDLRIGGHIRLLDEPRGVLGDAHTNEREILAYDPEHLLASRPVVVPADWPNREALLNTWTVVYFNSIAGATTHVRIVLLGLGTDDASQALGRATTQRLQAALDHLVKHFRPSCAHCEKPQ